MIVSESVSPDSEVKLFPHQCSRRFPQGIG